MSPGYGWPLGGETFGGGFLRVGDQRCPAPGWLDWAARSLELIAPDPLVRLFPYPR